MAGRPAGAAQRLDRAGVALPFPNHAEPGPAIGFLQEVLRWWDHWLKGIDSDIMDEPMLRAWIPDGVPPATFYSERPGR